MIMKDFPACPPESSGYDMRVLWAQCAAAYEKERGRRLDVSFWLYATLGIWLVSVIYLELVR